MITISILVQHHAGPTGNVLIAKNKDGVWEFPNGVKRTNETDQEASERIAWEVLGMKVVAGNLIMTGRKNPADGYVEHIVCGNITHNTHTKTNFHNYYGAVNKWQVEPKSDVYSEFKWVHPSELGNYEFGGDDVNFMAKYEPYVNSCFIPDVRMY
jgi:hypothetical protein